MRLAVTGGTGRVGRFIVEAALAAGDRVTLLSRRPPAPGLLPAPVEHRAFALGDAPPLEGFDGLVHAALDHVPGRYRGGEGDDPGGFLRRNLDGTVRLFEAARAGGVARVVFLSSRAVYGDHPPGTALHEALVPRPDTLYGRVKHLGEQALSATMRGGVSLRVTGVYGAARPGEPHKWSTLFADALAGRDVAPRAATEVHGRDVAAAVRLALRADAMAVLNVSDLVLDRADLLSEAATILGRPIALPAPAALPPLVMATDRIEALGWRGGGWPLLRRTLRAMLEQSGEGRRPPAG